MTQKLAVIQATKILDRAFPPAVPWLVEAGSAEVNIENRADNA